MQIGHIRVQNYRGLKNVEASFSNFACIIGENNAGKSSLLQAFANFLSSSRLDVMNHHDTSEPIVITVRFEDVTEADLSRLGERHRPRIEEAVYDGSLTFVRRYEPNEKPQLRIMKLVPKDSRFLKTNYDQGLGGKIAETRGFLADTFPEISPEDIQRVGSKSAARELIEHTATSLPREAKVEMETDLPTGIDASVKPFFPEPVYVPAVKDLSDDVKTNQSATFGKLLGLLLKEIEPELGDIQGWFDQIGKKLNSILDPDGNVIDNRIPEVQRIEATLEQNLRETFSHVGVELRIPPPEFKTIFQGADISIDDGVKGPIETKGDGLRRAATFAILRSYVDYSKGRSVELRQRRNEYVFLFEEPELYLHPVAQVTLFDALSLISKRHQVVMSTHSPYFFQPDNTDRFIKVKKIDSDPKPYGVLIPICLSDKPHRDLFQVISFETSNSAFFSRKVLLVEGDSEVIAIPHIARTLDPNWNFKKNHIAIVKISGKGSIRRYKEFFAAFDVQVMIMADLDVLVNGFSQLDVGDEIQQLRSSLLQKAKAILDAQNSVHGLVGQKKAKKTLSREDQSALWAQVQRDYRQYRKNEVQIANIVDSFEAFIEALRTGDRRIDVLTDNAVGEILQLKRELLAKLRCKQIYIWERGALEDYYPDGISASAGKPQQALEFCEQITTRGQIVDLCDEILGDRQGGSEIEVVFSSIFDDTLPNGYRDESQSG